VLISDLSISDLEAFQVRQKKAAYSDAYIDKQIESARVMVSKALDDNLIGGDCLRPFRKVRNLSKKGSNAREKILALDEFQRLTDNLPTHARGPVAMAFWTGMRSGEILNLTWDKIDLNGRIIKLDATDTKENRRKKIPIARPLRDFLLKIPGRGQESDDQDPDSGIVFKYAGRKIKDIRDSLKTACHKADIPYGRFARGGFVFHDLRHAFATYARRAGVARNIIMTIMGHSAGDDMNYRYDLIEDSDLIAAIDKIEVFLQFVRQNVRQTENLTTEKS
jgi:integrase